MTDPKRRYLLPDGVPRDHTKTKLFQNVLKAQRERFERALKYPNVYNLENKSTIVVGERETSRLRGQPNPFADLNRALFPVDLTLDIENNTGEEWEDEERDRLAESRREIAAKFRVLPSEVPGAEVPQSTAWEPSEGSAICDLFKMVDELRESEDHE